MPDFAYSGIVCTSQSSLQSSISAITSSASILAPRYSVWVIGDGIELSASLELGDNKTEGDWTVGWTRQTAETVARAQRPQTLICASNQTNLKIHYRLRVITKEVDVVVDAK